MSLNISWRSVIAGAIGMLLLLGLAAILVIATGGYNVAADDRHETLAGWALTTTMRNSVQARADGIDAPKFTPAMVAAGAPEYKSMCQHCHGGVGVKRDEWSHGMRPKPPPLAAAADRWRPREIFWIAKHGIKMTGMPAFGGSHDDRTLWNIAAFVNALPGMSASDYASYSAEHGGRGEGRTELGGSTSPHAH